MVYIIESFDKLSRCSTSVIVLSLVLLEVCATRRHISLAALKFSNRINTPNVRTVLFHEDDLDKACWALNDASQLFNRYLMQNLLPRKLPTNISLFLEYILLCIKTLDAEVQTSKVKEMMTEVFSDTFGGYLQAFVLPAAKRSYYEGNTNYETCLKLYMLQSDFKTVLKSDGGSWASPVPISGNRRKLQPLKINTISNACDKLIFSRKEPRKDSKKNDLQSKKPNCPWKRPVKTQTYLIPIPFFDDCRKPKAIAVPLKTCSLYSLTNNASKLILTRYYEISVSCINQQCKKQDYSTCQRKLDDFNKIFYAFLKKYVAPRLQDCKWYPGFYKIIPLMEVVKRSSYDEIDNEDEHKSCDYNDFKTYIQRVLSRYNEIFAFILSPLFLLFLLIFLMVIICLLCLFCKKKEHTEPCDIDEYQCGCKDQVEKGDVEEPIKTACTCGAPMNDETSDKCTKCICANNALVGFAAKFYYRKKCNNKTCTNKSQEQQDTSQEDITNKESEQEVLNTENELNQEYE